MIFNKPYGMSAQDRQEVWDLDTLMNTLVKDALNIPANVTWGAQSNAVFNTLREDFMKPVTEGSELI